MIVPGLGEYFELYPICFLFTNGSVARRIVIIGIDSHITFKSNVSAFKTKSNLLRKQACVRVFFSFYLQHKVLQFT